MSKPKAQDFEIEAICTLCGGTGKERRYSGARMRAHRVGRGVGLNETAHEMGRSGTFLSQIELGRTQPTEKFVREYLASIETIRKGYGQKDAELAARRPVVRQAREAEGESLAHATKRVGDGYPYHE